MEKSRILVVDDEQGVRELIVASLDTSRFVADEAVDGNDALNRILMDRPDLIILDWMMPKMSGPELINRLKDYPFTAHIPILMLTAKGQTEDKVEMLKMGADDYMAKPFSIDELLARMEALLRKTKRDLYADEETGLPGHKAVEDRLSALTVPSWIALFQFVPLESYGSMEEEQIVNSLKVGAEIIFQHIVKNELQQKAFLGRLKSGKLIMTIPGEFSQALVDEIIEALDMAFQIRRTNLVQQGKLDPAVPPLASQLIIREVKSPVALTPEDLEEATRNPFNAMAVTLKSGYQKIGKIG